MRFAKMGSTVGGGDGPALRVWAGMGWRRKVTSVMMPGVPKALRSMSFVEVVAGRRRS